MAGPDWGENDSYYHYQQDTAHCQLTGYPLRLSFDGSTNAGGGHGQLVSNLIVWEASVGVVSPPYCPTYSAAHQYDVVVNLGSQSGQITLGPGDQGYSDNYGQFIIEVEQILELPPTP